jgi:hypothetical protein
MAGPADAPEPGPRDACADLACLGLLTVGLHVPALAASRHLDFNDGTYGASAIAMRRGAIPYREVFSSQGPLHLPLVWLFDLPRTAWSPRLAGTVAAVVLTVVVYLTARRLTTRDAALAAAVVIATSGSILWTTGPILADGPAAAFVALAFLLALRYEEAPGVRRALLVGLAAGAAVLVKPALGALGCLAAVVLLVRGRRPRDLLAAVAAAAALAAALVVPFGPARVWDQSVRYQLDSDREAGIAPNLDKVWTTLWHRDLVVLAAVVLAAATLVVRSRRGAPIAIRARPVIVAGAWLLPVLAFVVLQPALWRQHVAALVTPLVLIAAPHLPARRWLLAVALVVIPAQVVRVDDILHPAPYRGAEREAHATLVALDGPGEILADEVGLVWRAGRAVPGPMVDTSIKQFDQRRITEQRLARASAPPEACGVLVWRARYFGSFRGLAARLEAEGYAPARRFPGQGGARVLYLRSPCRLGP